ncbi:PfkB family carbohydrate kinase [Natrononativus amylolyticus]|uniref:PfkB family carbohydrate kinase n=1 Tax=Natrononativus amylolyticus TaxID=2963434 RepID=UPI0020CC2B82|nr:PfkB family carbohydrate kinase [Natrononativus amylolyticus]
MGEPARVRVLTFDGGGVLFPERAGTQTGWGLEELRAAVDWERLASADALCCVNAASFPRLSGVFEALGSTEPARGRPPLVADLGTIGAIGEDELAAVLEGLGSADAAFEVVFSGNRAECTAAIAATGGPAEPDVDRAALERLRSSLGISAAVLHGAEEAAPATRDGTTTVAMLEAGETTRTTGAGDRFSGGLACGRARGWSWDTALALGNACAARFVATARTGDPETLRAFVERR